jgi:hypothetical protein
MQHDEVRTILAQGRRCADMGQSIIKFTASIKSLQKDLFKLTPVTATKSALTSSGDVYDPAPMSTPPSSPSSSSSVSSHDGQSNSKKRRRADDVDGANEEGADALMMTLRSSKQTKLREPISAKISVKDVVGPNVARSADALAMLRELDKHVQDLPDAVSAIESCNHFTSSATLSRILAFRRVNCKATDRVMTQLHHLNMLDAALECICTYQYALMQLNKMIPPLNVGIVFPRQKVRCGSGLVDFGARQWLCAIPYLAINRLIWSDRKMRVAQNFYKSF